MKHFLDMAKIPHGSGNEAAVSTWLAGFGKNLGFETIIDESYNVIIRKPGTVGYENAPRVILQGHLDMVCEKNNNTEHDFITQGINVLSDGKYLSADGTTLGADNAVAVAYTMAVLEADDIPHPPLTVIMTTNEEVGLLGATALNAKYLSDAKYMINLDSGGDNIFTVGCAGGNRTAFTIKCKPSPIPAGYSAMQISVSGLLGGHSGKDINAGRGNANIFIGRLIYPLISKYGALISTINGGDKDNAIPREAHAIICIPNRHLNEAKNELGNINNNIKTEYSISEPNAEIEFIDVAANKAYSEQFSLTIASLLRLIPNGVQAFDQTFPDLIETSLSLGVVKADDEGVTFYSAVRSSVRSKKSDVVSRLKTLADTLNIEIKTYNEYPEWQFKRDSILQKICGDVNTELFGVEAAFHIMHGGLECGVILDKAPQLDIIAMGPNLFDNHSPDERLEIASFGRCWEVLKAVLKKMK
ncbi:MAG: beta-Ala-His dipeptidase [Defluviitaleaceae bacterium]|nr:beta-Ala-His dipeptidase [Defluviitaleaceae bacterium]